MPADRDISPFIQFVLHRLQVKTNVCSRQHSDSGYHLEPRTVVDYNLIFVTRGCVVWVVDGREHALADGDLVLVPPATPHRAYSLDPRVTLYSIHVEASLPGGRDVFSLLNPPEARRVQRGGRLDAYLRGAAKEWRRADQTLCRLMLSHWSRLIVPELLLEDARQGALRPQPIDPVVAEMLQELPLHIARPTALQELARQSGYTPQHLNRLFRRALGITPLQHLSRLRMERAASLLADGRWTVAGVARQVGFEDPYYFSRLFKRHFGRGPSRYREAAGSNSPSPDSSPPFNPAHS
jgi:AraC-like DNA-binding protein